jgi:hypothetical protein
MMNIMKIVYDNLFVKNAPIEPTEKISNTKLDNLTFKYHNKVFEEYCRNDFKKNIIKITEEAKHRNSPKEQLKKQLYNLESQVNPEK